MVFWSLRANSSSFAILPMAPLPALMSSVSFFTLAMVCVGVVVKRGIFEQFPGGALAGIQVVNHQVQLVHRAIDLVVKLFVRKKFAQRAFALGHLVHQSLEFSDRACSSLL